MRYRDSKWFAKDLNSGQLDQQGICSFHCQIPSESVDTRVSKPRKKSDPQNTLRTDGLAQTTTKLENSPYSWVSLIFLHNRKSQCRDW